MDKHYLNIFRKLRDYFVSPGLNLWGRIRKRLFTSDFPDDNKLPLKDFEVHPPQELFEQVLDTIQQLQIKNKFERLTEHKMAVPEGYFDRIIDLIRSRKRRIAVIARMPSYQKWIAAASVIGIIGCIFWLLNRKQASEPDLVKSNETYNAPLVISDSAVAVTDSVNNKGNGLEEKKRIFYTAAVKPAMQTVEMSKVMIDGIEIPVENNEILYSLVNYANGKDINWKKAKKFIKLNDYAGISISPYISNVIEDLYSTKKNGKKTARAKKAASKIKKWRKADIKTFDKKKNRNRNPLDIIHLGDNVYK